MALTALEAPNWQSYDREQQFMNRRLQVDDRREKTPTSAFAVAGFLQPSRHDGRACATDRAILP
jgi:hypothetical protein